MPACKPHVVTGNPGKGSGRKSPGKLAADDGSRFASRGDAPTRARGAWRRPPIAEPETKRLGSSGRRRRARGAYSPRGWRSGGGIWGRTLLPLVGVYWPGRGAGRGFCASVTCQPPPRIGVIFRVGGAARGAPAPSHRSYFSSLPVVTTGLRAQASGEDSEEDARPRTAPRAGCKIWGAGESS